MTFEIPIKVTNDLNGPQRNWRAKAGRRKKIRALTARFIGTRKPPMLPCTVLLTRCGPNKRPMDEGDGLPASLKSVRDEIAVWLGADDGDKRIQWWYEQRRQKEWAVLVEIIERGE